MELNNLVFIKKSKKISKRLGRGTGSGKGKTCGRGTKGQKSRSGFSLRLGFEGGQTPLFRRIPKFGFNNINNKKKYKIINLKDIEKYNIEIINHKTLLEKKIINSEKELVKILGNFKLKKSLFIKVDKISKNAKKNIEDAGGKVEVL